MTIIIVNNKQAMTSPTGSALQHNQVTITSVSGYQETDTMMIISSIQSMDSVTTSNCVNAFAQRCASYNLKGEVKSKEKQPAVLHSWIYWFDGSFSIINVKELLKKTNSSKTKLCHVDNTQPRSKSKCEDLKAATSRKQ